MNKKRVSKILTIFLLVQHISALQLCAETFPLNPQTKVSLNETSLPFNYLRDVIHLALLLYKLDAVENNTKEDIVRDQAAIFASLSNVRFDLERIDIRKKGWTRYYPFSINDYRFLIRIFLTEEIALQPKVSVLYEGSIDNPSVTFQILPCMSDILKACEIKPFAPRSPSQVDISV